MDVNLITIFILAIFVGNEIINKVPPTLHTPLMSGSNAISGIAIVGALLAIRVGGEMGTYIGLAALICAMLPHAMTHSAFACVILPCKARSGHAVLISVSSCYDMFQRYAPQQQLVFVRVIGIACAWVLFGLSRSSAICADAAPLPPCF